MISKGRDDTEEPASLNDHQQSHLPRLGYCITNCLATISDAPFVGARIIGIAPSVAIVEKIPYVNESSHVELPHRLCVIGDKSSSNQILSVKD